MRERRDVGAVIRQGLRRLPARPRGPSLGRHAGTAASTSFWTSFTYLADKAPPPARRRVIRCTWHSYSSNQRTASVTSDLTTGINLVLIWSKPIYMTHQVTVGTDPMPLGTGLMMIGHPSGTPAPLVRTPVCLRVQLALFPPFVSFGYYVCSPTAQTVPPPFFVSRLFFLRPAFFRWLLTFAPSAARVRIIGLRCADRPVPFTVGIRSSGCHDNQASRVSTPARRP